jgi:hypothetical protein
MNQDTRGNDRKRILSILGVDRDLINMATNAKLYSANSEAVRWLYSDLEGIPCFILDYNTQSKYIVLFDPDTYEVLFSIELYNNFANYYQQLSDDFHCFEVGNGFLGLKFSDNKEGDLFLLTISKFKDDFCKMLFQGCGKNNKTNTRKWAQEYCSILKEKFGAKNTFDENYIEDGCTIIKPKYFEFLDSINYDHEKKEFLLDHITNEFKTMFKDIGIKKSDFKNPEVALTIVKTIVESMDSYDPKRRETTVKKRMSMANNKKVDTTNTRRLVPIQPIQEGI